jgi:uncharacterized alkaline shock family protein YloU
MNTEPIESNASGIVKISEDVIMVIASKEVSEVENVVGLYSPSKQGFLGLKGNNKSVRSEIKNKNAKIDMDITVKYGTVIADTALVIQERVKKAVESMTGLNVESVNVTVKSIQFPEETVSSEE